MAMRLDQFLRAFTVDKEVDSHLLSGNYNVFRGHCVYDDYFSLLPHIPEGFEERSDWRDGRHRAVWISGHERTIITYCKGDIIVQCCPNYEMFNDLLVEAATFYKDH